MAIFNGNSNDNNLIGTEAADEINGLRGDDTLKGLGGNDQLNGGRGQDTLKGGTGSDILNGGAGNDVLKPFERLVGQPEYDKLTGGDGADLFDMTNAVGGVAYMNDDSVAESNGFGLIQDFSILEGDKIQLDGFATYYHLRSASGDYGKADTSDTLDVELVYTGVNQNQFSQVVAVLQDVSSQFVSNPAGYLNNPNVFQFLG